MSKYKPGDKIIILDYNGKPLVPQVVAKIEEVYGDGRVRLDLPDGAACFEYEDHFKKVDDETYDKYLQAVHDREQELPLDLKMDIRKFVANRPRLRREILRNYELDKKYVSIIHAYAGRIQMYGRENIPPQFIWEFEDAKIGLTKTRSFFHDIDPSIKEVEIPDQANAPVEV
ncbi:MULTISPECIES: hypothetical protein [unclassified Butyrivibrio]|uniref:hypothetical protein n=1 Tax=unclassified Butyrivibrio TaxID=2639466 RepID=UPI000406B9A8|nr:MULTISPECIES: hypothetical protein [unclassified Butyrivibrio]